MGMHNRLSLRGQMTPRWAQVFISAVWQGRKRDTLVNTLIWPDGEWRDRVVMSNVTHRGQTLKNNRGKNPLRIPTNIDVKKGVSFDGLIWVTLTHFTFSLSCWSYVAPTQRPAPTHQQPRTQFQFIIRCQHVVVLIGKSSIDCRFNGLIHRFNIRVSAGKKSVLWSNPDWGVIAVFPEH